MRVSFLESRLSSVAIHGGKGERREGEEGGVSDRAPPLTENHGGGYEKLDLD